jgi:hypothetical protein
MNSLDPIVCIEFCYSPVADCYFSTKHIEKTNTLTITNNPVACVTRVEFPLYDPTSIEGICKIKCNKKLLAHESDMSTKIHYAVQYGMNAFVRNHYRYPIDNNTILFCATRHDNAELVKWILSKGIEYVNVKTAMHHAYYYSTNEIISIILPYYTQEPDKKLSTETIIAYLNQDITFNDQDCLERMLKSSCKSGDLKTVIKLLPRVNNKTNLLQLALYSNQQHVAAYLLQEGHEHIRIPSVFEFACGDGRLGIVKQFVDCKSVNHDAGLLRAYLRNQVPVLLFLQEHVYKCEKYINVLIKTHYHDLYAFTKLFDTVFPTSNRAIRQIVSWKKHLYSIPAKTLLPLLQSYYIQKDCYGLVKYIMDHVPEIPWTEWCALLVAASHDANIYPGQCSLICLLIQYVITHCNTKVLSSFNQVYTRLCTIKNARIMIELLEMIEPYCTLVSRTYETCLMNIVRNNNVQGLEYMLQRATIDKKKNSFLMDLFTEACCYHSIACMHLLERYLTRSDILSCIIRLLHLGNCSPTYGIYNNEVLLYTLSRFPDAIDGLIINCSDAVIRNSLLFIKNNKMNYIK